MLIKLAWLNIWRNKRRTFITMASVFFAVILAVIMRCSVQGNFDNMIENIVAFSSGYAQVHLKGYWAEQSIDNAFADDPKFYDQLSKLPSVKSVLPRLEAFALVSGIEKTKGAMIIGIDPSKERIVNKLDKKIVAGNYPIRKDQQTLIAGEGLCKLLNLHIGDTLILLGQGYHGSSAAAKFPVTGIIKLGSPQLNDNIIYLSLNDAQKLYNAEGLITSYSLTTDKPENLSNLISELQANTDTTTYEVMSWKQMLPEMDQFVEADSSAHFVYVYILYMIIAFGIFSTLLMMTMERMHEFGILVAIGMKKIKLGLILIAESIFVSLLGCISGIIAGYGIVAWGISHPIHFTGQYKEAYERYGLEPIIKFSDDSSIFISQALVILVLAILLAIYPFIKIIRFKPLKAINS